MIFVDTSGLMCFMNASESFHPEAVRWFNSGRRLLTHNYVLSEFVALAHSRRMPRRRSLEFVRDLRTSHAVEVFFIDEAFHDRSLVFLEARLDKSWSLCDAAAIVLMGDRRISDVLTTDHHFDQAGLGRLLR